MFKKVKKKTRKEPKILIFFKSGIKTKDFWRLESKLTELESAFNPQWRNFPWRINVTYCDALMSFPVTH